MQYHARRGASVCPRASPPPAAAATSPPAGRGTGPGRTRLNVGRGRGPPHALGWGYPPPPPHPANPTPGGGTRHRRTASCRVRPGASSRYMHTRSPPPSGPRLRCTTAIFMGPATRPAGAAAGRRKVGAAGSRPGQPPGARRPSWAPQGQVAEHGARQQCIPAAHRGRGPRAPASSTLRPGPHRERGRGHRACPAPSRDIFPGRAGPRGPVQAGR